MAGGTCFLLRRTSGVLPRAGAAYFKTMPSFLKLKPTTHARVLRGHPWVYAGEVQKLLPASYDGQAVELRDSRGRSLGSGLYNSKSQLVWRRFSREARPFDAAYVRGAIQRAAARRASEPFRRLVWSEADHLPGLVVDQFEDVLVVQALALGVDRALPLISDILDELFRPAEIVYRNDAPTRKHEGLEAEARTRSGRPLEPRWFKIEGFEYHVDLVGGQKTGFYLDQRAQHRRVASFAKGRRVLDCFTNQGAFALHCARAGAAGVTAVDISEDCIGASRRNAERNGLSVDFVAANVFDWFGEHREDTFDLIVLDPPSFARNRQAVPAALRGYKELHLRALRMLTPGGILATYSCSHHVDHQTFLGTLADAAGDARREVRLLEETGQPSDHPILITMPESQYLKGLIVQAE